MVCCSRIDGQHPLPDIRERNTLRDRGLSQATAGHVPGARAGEFMSMSPGCVVKDGIHPKYVEATVTCGCGTSFKTRSTKPTINVEICSKCHPFFTGKVKYVDTAGRVEKFQRKYDWEARRAAQRETAAAGATKEAAAPKAK